MFVKYISTYQIEEPPHNQGRYINYHLNDEQLKRDGYLPLVEAKEPEQPELYVKKYSLKDGKVLMTYQKKNVIKKKED